MNLLRAVVRFVDRPNRAFGYVAGISHSTADIHHFDHDGPALRSTQYGQLYSRRQFQSLQDLRQICKAPDWPSLGANNDVADRASRDVDAAQTGALRR